MNLKDWILAVNRSLERIYPLEGRGIVLERTAAGTRIHATGTGGSSGGSSGGSTEYNGPFAVVKKTDTSVTVYGYNVTAPANRQFRAYAILGLISREFTESEVSSITSTGWVYLEISSGYAVSAKFATSLPPQDNTHIYHPIAHIVCADSKISSITQLQYGCVHFPARAL